MKSVAVKIGEAATGDERILGRIERRRIAERVGRIGGLRVGATHLALERRVLSPTGGIQRRRLTCDPLGGASTPVNSVPAVLAGSYRALPPEIRACDSITAMETGSAGAPPVLTRPTSSAGTAIVVGWNRGLIMYGGAAELPPDTLDWLPTRFSSLPRAPVMAMPYIGLCGF